MNLLDMFSSFDVPLGSTWQLLDEEDENGPVGLFTPGCQAPVIVMPRADWEAMRKEARGAVLTTRHPDVAEEDIET